MPKVTEPSFKFWFKEEWYTVQGAKTMLSTGTPDDISTIRSEYTRMRDAAQKRVKRLQKLFPDTVGAKQKYDTGRKNKDGEPIYASGFQKLRDIQPKDFAYAFSELAKFLRAKGSTVTGQREIERKTTKKLNHAIGDKDEKGNPITPVNPGNYWRVIKILNEARRQKVTYGSDKMVELADATLGLTNDQFDDILDSLQNTLKNSDTIGSSLEQYMKDKKIEGYQKVNIDDFLVAMGWKVPKLSEEE